MAITISQQIIYNIRSGTYHATKSTNIRHNEGHETPLLQTITLHDEGKRKKVINNVNAYGFSVSHCRVKWFVQDGVVLPTNRRCGVFVTFYHVSVDNFDNNNRGNFSQNAFHVTAISVTYHISCENKVVQRPHIQLDFTVTYVPQLPEAYAVIQPVEYLSNGLHVTCISIEFTTIS